MNNFKPAEIFAALPTNSSPKKESKRRPNDVNVSYLEGVTRGHLDKNDGNGLKVTSSGEMCLLPDRCQLLITVYSKKPAVEQARNSVTRRLDYVLQTLHNHHVKDSDIKVSKSLQRVDGLFIFTAEANITFMEPEKCQGVCNILVEKLDENVKVSTPTFYHSPQRLENLRRQTCILAVSNAKHKAVEIAKFLQCTLGKVITVQEEQCNEWEGSNLVTYDPENHMTFQQKFNQANTHVNVKVSVIFELLPTSKKTQSNEKQ